MASLVKWLYFSGARLVTGEPVASGSIYFYVAGSTSTEVQVYSDAAETPMTQPVALDAAGRAEVYLKVPAEVKVLNSLGSQVRLSTRSETVAAGQVDCTWNSTSAELDAVLTAIETNVGPAAKYLESGATGTVARTVHDALHFHITPKDFGAVGNGSADDTIPLQRAINQAIATKLPLFLGEYTYKVTSGLTIAGAVTIYSTNKDSCLVFGSSAFALWTINTGSDTAGLVMRGFSTLAPPTSGGTAFVVNRCYGAVFEDLNITGYNGFDFVYGGPTVATVSRCKVTGGTGAGFILAEGVNCYDCVAAMGASGDGFYTVGKSTLVNCTATGGTYGFHAYATGDMFVRCTGTLQRESAVLSNAIDCKSAGTEWGPSPGALASGFAVDHGSVDSGLVLPSITVGGAKMVSCRIYDVAIAEQTVTLTLTGLAAFTTAIKSAVATRADGYSTDVRIGTISGNTVQVIFVVSGVSNSSAHVVLTGY